MAAGIQKKVPGMSAGIQKKDHQISIKLASEQLAHIERSAKRCGVKVARWMRHILLQAATRQPAEGYLRIREPDGTTE